MNHPLGTPYLPQEVLDSCFDHLANDKSTLRKCLSVSPAILAACRRQLFRTVEIKPSDWGTPYGIHSPYDKFCNFWRSSNHLLRFVNVLVVETNFNQHEVRELLMAPFAGCHLQELRFSLLLTGINEGWEDVSRFLVTWSSSSLVSLELENIQSFPHELLLSLPNLEALRFCPGHSRTLVPSVMQGTLPTKGCIALRELEITDCIDDSTWVYLSHCIDYSSLRKLAINHRSKSMEPQLEDFLHRAAPYLEELIWRPAHILMTEDALEYPALQLRRFIKLRTLEIRGPHLRNWQSDRNIVMWIFRTMKSLPITHPLEKLVLDFPFRDLYPVTTSNYSEFCPYPHAPGWCHRAPFVERSSGHTRKHFELLDRVLLRLVNLKTLDFASHARDIEAFNGMKEKGKLVVRQRDICWGAAGLAFWDEYSRNWDYSIWD